MLEQFVSRDEALRLVHEDPDVLERIACTIEDEPVEGGILTARKINGETTFILRKDRRKKQTY